MSFSYRAGKHDSEAIPFVTQSFAKYEFDCYVMGTEADGKSAREALVSQSDNTSIMLRYRPDRFFTKRGDRTVLCEIKCEWQGYSNFSIEFDSYVASKQWNGADRHVMYALVDLSKSSIFCCWVDNLPKPSKVYVPKRFDFIDTWQRLKREHPGINLKEGNYTSGSGTPYFLFPKTHKCLVPFDTFVTNELIMAYHQESLFNYYAQGM